MVVFEGFCGLLGGLLNTSFRTVSLRWLPSGRYYSGIVSKYLFESHRAFLLKCLPRGKGLKLRILLAFILGASIFCTTGASAQVKATPKAQTGVFAKVFKFTKAFRGKKVKVLGVYDDATKADVEAMVAAFSGRGLKATACGEADVATSLGGVQVVYLLKSSAAIKPLLKSKKILTITGDTSLVEGGEVSVGVMDNSGKMVITVNLPHAKAEGHAFAPSFLKLTKVIR